MDDRRSEGGQRVTPWELFFDLVVVFAITQVTEFLYDDPTWAGLLRGLVLLGHRMDEQARPCSSIGALPRGQ